MLYPSGTRIRNLGETLRNLGETPWNHQRDLRELWLYDMKLGRTTGTSSIAHGYTVPSLVDHDDGPSANTVGRGRFLLCQEISAACRTRTP